MKRTVLFFLLGVVVMSGCVKDRSSPTIVGTWKLTNIAGNYVYQNSPGATPSTTTYSYTPASNILTEIESSGTYSDTILVTVYNEVWAFNSNSAFNINENLVQGTDTTDHTLTGWWDYTGSSIPNSSVILRSTGVPAILNISNVYFIQSVTSNQLVLTVDESNTSTTGPSTTYNYTLTFARQQ